MKTQRLIEKLPLAQQVLPKPRCVLFRNLETLKDNLPRSKLKIFSPDKAEGYKDYEEKNFKIFRKTGKGWEFKINSNVKLFKINLRFDCDN